MPQKRITVKELDKKFKNLEDDCYFYRNEARFANERLERIKEDFHFKTNLNSFLVIILVCLNIFISFAFGYRFEIAENYDQLMLEQNEAVIKQLLVNSKSQYKEAPDIDSCRSKELQ